MKLINLTPHALRVYSNDGAELLVELPPSGSVARVLVTRVDAGRISVPSPLADKAEGGTASIGLARSTYGAVTGLPEATADTVLVVSALVRLALPLRADLASPRELIRDSAGQPVGCKGLEVS